MVFLADDDADDCIIFEEALREVNNEVGFRVASNGKLLMDMLRQDSLVVPDLLFLDLNMPLMNGFECLEAIRKDERLFKIPVIMFTTTSVLEFINKAYDGGADYYVTKPESFSKMKSMISEILSKDWKNHSVQPHRENFVLV